jgi:hypothetical protein
MMQSIYTLLLRKLIASSEHIILDSHVSAEWCVCVQGRGNQEVAAAFHILKSGGTGT